MHASHRLGGLVATVATLVACATASNPGGADPGAGAGDGATGSDAARPDGAGGFDVGSGSDTDASASPDSSAGADSKAGGDTSGGGDGTSLDTAPPTDAGATFGTTCGATGAPKVTGVSLAPNGVDPVPTSEIYAPIVVNAFVPGVSCDTCDKPIDTYWTSTKSATDGTFTLDLSAVPASAAVKIAVRKGRFRKVVTIAPECGKTTALAAAQTTLPGTTPTGDDSMPKIAVGTGNSDHLDTILTALGIQTFDCYEGRKTTAANCPSAEATGKRVSALLTDATSLNGYNLLFLSCAPGVWSSYSATDQASIAANLKAWVDAGGRLIATDQSYDYVSQPWPDDIAWQGPAGPPWAIGTTSGGGANVGLSPAAPATSYSATIDDAPLSDWLKLVGVATAPTVDISGWLNHWSVQKSLPTTSTQIAHGDVSFEYPAGSAPTPATLPLTSEFVKNKCGRVIYSSYHTLSGVSAGSLTAQERILEYLMLEVASCLRG